MVSKKFQNPTDFLITNSAPERCHTTSLFYYEIRPLLMNAVSLR